MEVFRKSLSANTQKASTEFCTFRFLQSNSFTSGHQRPPPNALTFPNSPAVYRVTFLSRNRNYRNSHSHLGILQNFLYLRLEENFLANSIMLQRDGTTLHVSREGTKFLVKHRLENELTGVLQVCDHLGALRHSLNVPSGAMQRVICM
jgi:hypothetical protein